MSGVIFVSALLAFAVLRIRYKGVSSDVLEAVRDREEVLQRLARLRRYRDNQYQAVQEWIDQRCFLEETMQQFQELDREYTQAQPSFPSMAHQRLPKSDEERHYLLIRERVEKILRGRTEELTAARRRLEKEHQQLQARD
jgi:hypothetical protein